MAKRYPILILGHPRCGTGYMAKLMQSYGLDVRHEQIGQHGTSNWMFAVRSGGKPWGVKANWNIEFDHVIHVHPNPWKGINSISFKENLSPRSVAFRKRFIDLPDELNIVDKAVKSLIEWNALIEMWQPDLTVTVGTAARACYEYLLNEGFVLQRKPGQLPDLGHVNSRKRYDLPPGEITKLMSFPHREKFLKYANEVMEMEKQPTYGF